MYTANAAISVHFAGRLARVLDVGVCGQLLHDLVSSDLSTTVSKPEKIFLQGLSVP